MLSNIKNDVFKFSSNFMLVLWTYEVRKREQDYVIV